MTARDDIAAHFTSDTLADQLLDAHRAEVLAEADLLPKADVVAWLVKKAREETPVWLLASKVERGAVRPDNLRMLPADFYEPGHTYLNQQGWTFRCDAVTNHPVTGKRVAIGYSIFSHNDCQTSDLTEDAWAEGAWTDITDTTTGDSK